jgi:hypothetical protein
MWMIVTFEDVGGMAFIACVGALGSFAVLAYSKRAAHDMRFALTVQSAVVLGLGFFFLLGAGLASPPGYPHTLIPVTFLIVLAIAHWVWRWSHPSDP